MRIFILLLLLIQGYWAFSQEFEIEYFEQSETSNFRGVFFSTDQTGYAISYSGQIIKSINGGQSWITTDLENELPLLGIHFINENLGFAVGGDTGCSPAPCNAHGSKIFKTTNGGGNWTEIRLDDRILHSVYFIDDNIGFAGGLGNLFKTVDGGESWNAIQLDDFINIGDIKFNNGMGFIVGGSGKIFSSSDGGNEWILMNSGTSSYIQAIDFCNEDVGYAGTSDKIIKTNDGGENWEILPNSPDQIYSIKCLGDSFIVASGRGIFTGASGFKGGIYISQDGGNNWLAYDNLEITSIAYTHFPTDNLGFGVGLNEKIMKFSIDNMLTSSFESLSERRMLIFPNPAKDIIHLKNVTLSRGDLLTISNQDGHILIEKPIQDHTIDISELKSGVYYLRIVNDKELNSCKIVIL